MPVGPIETSGTQSNWKQENQLHTVQSISQTGNNDKWVQNGDCAEERGGSSTNLVAFPNSRRMAGGVEALQSQQVQLGIWVVSDLMDNLEDDR